MSWIIPQVNFFVLTFLFCTFLYKQFTKKRSPKDREYQKMQKDWGYDFNASMADEGIA